MKIARVVRNVILAGMAWRLIVLRRGALARERRARRIVPLVIAAAGTGVILTARPRIVGAVRHLWGRRRSNGETSNVARQPPGVERAPERKKSLPRKPAPVRPRRTGKNRAPAGTEPKPGVKH